MDFDIVWPSLEYFAPIWPPLGAFAVGIAGSIAYFTVVYFGFIGSGEDSRNFILKFFQSEDDSVSLRKIVWYSLIGGTIATIFQLAESQFVPIQSFVLGTTWPSVVGQLLSGRQTGISQDQMLLDSNLPFVSEVEEERESAAESFGELLGGRA